MLGPRDRSRPEDEARVPKSAYTRASSGTKVGYMCAIDWQYEMGHAGGGNKVHPSIEDLRECHPCADDCGIVEVEITLRRQVV